MKLKTIWKASWDKIDTRINLDTVTHFIFLGSKITADGDCSHEIKRHLLLGRKAMTNLDSILKSRDITLLTKVHLVKATVFPVVMYGSESWTIKKAEHQRTDAFELWCWRRLLRVPWTARISNQSILKEISPEYSLEGLMLRLKLWHLPPDAKNWLIWKDPDAAKDWKQEKRMTESEMVGWHHRLNGYESEQAPGDGDGWEAWLCCSPWGHKESDTTEQLNWIELKIRLKDRHLKWHYRSYKNVMGVSSFVYAKGNCESFKINNHRTSIIKETTAKRVEFSKKIFHPK